MSATEPRTVWVVCHVCKGSGDDPDGIHQCDYCKNPSGMYEATLLPLADGQMCVVDKAAWEAFMADLTGIVRRIYDEGTDEGRAQPPHFRPFEEWARDIEANYAIPLLTALFGKDGIEVAETVGTLCDSGVGDPTAYLSIGNATDGTYRTIDGYNITGRRVALLKEASDERD